MIHTPHTPQPPLREQPGEFSASLHRPRPLNPETWLLPAVALLLIGLFVAHAFDLSQVAELDKRFVEGRDWHRLTRLMGYIGTWSVIALALLLINITRRNDPERFSAQPAAGRASTPLSIPFFLIGCAGLAGLVAEGVKLLVRRGRPDALINANASLPLNEASTYAYTWHWSAPIPKPGEQAAPFLKWFFDTSDLGLASSHAAVAFAGAWALALVFRRSPLVAVLSLFLAYQTALGRLHVRDHYISDVVAGALIGTLITAVIWALWKRSTRN
ncbi:MAG: phosphatase PAP2 family protein [Phycisphaerales bacterium]|nr:phosphatase PAP2 family protein [Phycisphaerales bacterium]